LANAPLACFISSWKLVQDATSQFSAHFVSSPTPSFFVCLLFAEQAVLVFGEAFNAF
jgi:hypothetical protein